jgi:hypothetical protein
MPAGNNSTVAKPGSRLRELGLVLPKPPSPLGAYVEASQVGSLLSRRRLPLLPKSFRSRNIAVILWPQIPTRFQSSY